MNRQIGLVHVINDLILSDIIVIFRRNENIAHLIRVFFELLFVEHEFGSTIDIGLEIELLFIDYSLYWSVLRELNFVEFHESLEFEVVGQNFDIQNFVIIHW